MLLGFRALGLRVESLGCSWSKILGVFQGFKALGLKMQMLLNPGFRGCGSLGFGFEGLESTGLAFREFSLGFRV